MGGVAIVMGLASWLESDVGSASGEDNRGERPRRISLVFA